jgi:hypothetical protein
MNSQKWSSGSEFFLWIKAAACPDLWSWHASNRTIEQEQKLIEFIGADNNGERPIKPNIIDHPLNDQFLMGLIDGDGSFSISFKANMKIQFGFHIVQDEHSFELLEKVKALLGCGIIEKTAAGYLRFRIDEIRLIHSILIPFVDKYTLHSHKSVHYRIFKEVVTHFVDHPKPSDANLLKIIDLAYNMNKEGKRRKLSKEEYINKYLSQREEAWFIANTPPPY